MDQIQAILAAHKKELLQLKNVVAVGLGYKTRAGQKLSTPSIVVFVSEKLPAGQLAPQDLVPAEIGGVMTDVVAAGLIKPLLNFDYNFTPPIVDPTQKVRPLQPGCSIGHYLVSAGTLGCIVRDRQTSRPLLLSNNHILANSSNGSDGRCRAGDPVLQPGAYDGGQYPRDIIASLERYIPIREMENLADAAVAAPINDLEINEEIIGAGPIKGITSAIPGMAVQKFGRTTRLTRGEVIAIQVDTNPIRYNGHTAAFINQIFLSKMSAGGDSGSLILDTTNNAIGLLFAGSDIITIASPIANVLNGLDVYI